MIALIRYAFVKSARERFLLPFLFAPAVFVGAPILGVVADALIHHQRAFPLRLPTLSFAQTDAAVLLTCAMVVAATSGAAAFWVFRTDVANRSVSFFILSCRHAVSIPLSAVVFALALGITSFALAWPLTIVATAGIPADSGRAFAVAMLCSWMCASVGALVVTLSPAAGSLSAFPVIAVLLVVLTSFRSTSFILGAACVLTAVLNATAAMIMERRCAA